MVGQMLAIEIESQRRFKIIVPDLKEIMGKYTENKEVEK